MLGVTHPWALVVCWSILLGYLIFLFAQIESIFGNEAAAIQTCFLVGGKFKILLMVENATGRRKRIIDPSIEMEVRSRVMINGLVVCLSFVLDSKLESDPSMCPAEMYR